MERVSLTYFVDFVLKVGTPKLSGVKEFKEHRYDHLTDFYKPLREAIIDVHEKGKPHRALDDFLLTLTDERKRRIFPGLVEGYLKFVKPGMRWFTPPATTLPVADLSVGDPPLEEVMRELFKGTAADGAGKRPAAGDAAPGHGRVGPIRARVPARIGRPGPVSAGSRRAARVSSR